MNGRDLSDGAGTAGAADGRRRGARAVRRVAVALVVAACLGGGAWALRAPSARGAGTAVAATYRCPMHPAVVQDRPGSCASCGMELVAVANASSPSGRAGAGKYWCPMHPEVTSDDPNAECEKCGGMKLVARDEAAEGSAAARTTPIVSTDRTQRTGLRPARVAREAGPRQLRSTGYVVPKRDRLAVVLARTAGWVERSPISQVGQRVGRGEVLLTIQNPSLEQDQQSYLSAVRWRQNVAELKKSAMPESAKLVTKEPRLQLTQAGMAPVDIEELERTGKPSSTLRVRSPIAGVVVARPVVPGQYVEIGDELFQVADLATVWVVAEVGAPEVRHVSPGQRARLVLPGGAEAVGKIDFVYPALDPATRRAQARMEVRNVDGRLRPGTYGDVVIDVGEAATLVVPSDAVVDTGDRQYAFVVREGGRVEPRLVRTGASRDGRTEILDGVREGEEVATSAAFLFDSETRIRAAVEAAVTGR